jgi:hypothetical protein
MATTKWGSIAAENRKIRDLKKGNLQNGNSRRKNWEFWIKKRREARQTGGLSIKFREEVNSVFFFLARRQIE